MYTVLIPRLPSRRSERDDADGVIDRAEFERWEEEAAPWQVRREEREHAEEAAVLGAQLRLPMPNTMALLLLLLSGSPLAAPSPPPPVAAASRPQPMQSLLDGVRAIPDVFAGWTPQVSFFNQPDGSVGFCFQGSPLPSDYRGEYCMASSSSGHEWTPARQVRGAPLPPNGSKFSAPPLLQWNGKQGAAAAAGQDLRTWRAQ